MKGFIFLKINILYLVAISYNEASVQHIMRQTLFIILWWMFFISSAKLGT